MSFRPSPFYMKRKSLLLNILLCFCLISILFILGTCGDEGETTKEENGGTELPITNGEEPPANGGVEPPPGPGISFAKDIKPIFDENCNLPFCHGANPISGLLLTSYDNFKKGGNSGPGFIPKNSADSKIMEKIKPGGGMPPGGELPEAERNKIKDWIDAGGEDN